MGCAASKADGKVSNPNNNPYAPVNPQDAGRDRRQQHEHQKPANPAATSTNNATDKPAPGTGGSNANRPRPTSTRSRPDNNTVDFQEFKDDEKNVVETMLESNKGLRMAEINFHDLKLSKIIGAGAFGEVIKGTYCGTPVVVKRMLRNKITEDNLRMFGEEIQLMMNLRHPNIVQVRSDSHIESICVYWWRCVCLIRARCVCCSQFIGASWNSYSNMCVLLYLLPFLSMFSLVEL